MKNNLNASKFYGMLLATFAFSPFSAALCAGEWRQFRGNAANSIAEGESLPTELSGRNIAWKTELPGRGVSGPIVVEGQILLTASSGLADDRLHIMSYDAATGELQWERQFQATGRTTPSQM